MALARVFRAHRLHGWAGLAVADHHEGKPCPSKQEQKRPGPEQPSSQTARWRAEQDEIAIAFGEPCANFLIGSAFFDHGPHPLAHIGSDV